MNFAEILHEKYRYAFADVIRYISVQSIEDAYVNLYQPENQDLHSNIFASFMSREAALMYPTIDRVYNFVMLNPNRVAMTPDEHFDRMRQLASTRIDVKIAHLIHVDYPGDTFIHPMLAIMFAININHSFTIEVIGHLSGLRLTCDSSDATVVFPHEETCERKIEADEYKKSIELSKILIANLQAQLESANNKINLAKAENVRLGILLNEQQTANKSRIAKICEWFKKISNNTRIKRESFYSM